MDGEGLTIDDDVDVRLFEERSPPPDVGHGTGDGAPEAHESVPCDVLSGEKALRLDLADRDVGGDEEVGALRDRATDQDVAHAADARDEAARVVFVIDKPRASV